MTVDLWEVRTLPDGLVLELRGGDKPGLVLVHGSDRVIVELAHVKALIAAMGDAAADFAAELTGRGRGQANRWESCGCRDE